MRQEATRREPGCGARRAPAGTSGTMQSEGVRKKKKYVLTESNKREKNDNGLSETALRVQCHHIAIPRLGSLFALQGIDEIDNEIKLVLELI